MPYGYILLHLSLFVRTLKYCTLHCGNVATSSHAIATTLLSTAKQLCHSATIWISYNTDLLKRANRNVATTYIGIYAIAKRMHRWAASRKQHPLSTQLSATLYLPPYSKLLLFLVAIKQRKIYLSSAKVLRCKGAQLAKPTTLLQANQSVSTKHTWWNNNKCSYYCFAARFIHSFYYCNR